MNHPIEACDLGSAMADDDDASADNEKASDLIYQYC